MQMKQFSKYQKNKISNMMSNKKFWMINSTNQDLNNKMTNKTKSLNIIVKNNKNIRLYLIKGLNVGKFFQILEVLIKSLQTISV